MVIIWKNIELFLITNFPGNAVGISNPCGNKTGRCGVSPLEGASEGKAFPLKNKLKGDKLNG